MATLRKDTVETRRQLLDAAEKLFVERGIDNVTLIDIGREACQRNRNATQYHFGDKSAVLHAVLDRHTDPIASRRREMLDALKKKQAITLRDLVEVYVRPVAEHVAKTNNSMAFLLINSQLMVSRDYPNVGRDRFDSMPEVQQMSEMFARLQPSVDVKTRRAQVLLMRSMLHHGLASFRLRYPKEDLAVVTNSLCAGIEAVLAVQGGTD